MPIVGKNDRVVDRQARPYSRTQDAFLVVESDSENLAEKFEDVFISYNVLTELDRKGREDFIAYASLLARRGHDDHPLFFQIMREDVLRGRQGQSYASLGRFPLYPYFRTAETQLIADMWFKRDDIVH